MPAGALLLAMLLAAPIATGSGPPFYPPEPERVDELAVVPREWTEVGREDGPVIDVEGTLREAHQGQQTGVGYRLHGDIAAAEGTFTLASAKGDPKPVFNTGFRLDRVVFDPPFGLAGGDQLEGILAPALDWTEALPFAPTGGRVWTADLAYGFHAEVPAPAPDGWSPPHNRTDGNATHDGEAGPSTGIVVRWSVGFTDHPRDDLMVHLASPAMAHVGLRVEVPERAVDEETWAHLNETRATFSLLYDFAGSQRVVAVTGPGALRAQGVYLLQETRAATLRILDLSHPEVTYGTPTGRAPPGPVERVMNAPVVLDTTVRLEGPLTEPEHGNTTIRVAETYAELGFLMDLPEPEDSPLPTDPSGAPGPHLVILLLVIGLLVGRRSRTDIDT